MEIAKGVCFICTESNLVLSNKYTNYIRSIKDVFSSNKQFNYSEFSNLCKDKTICVQCAYKIEYCITTKTAVSKTVSTKKKASDRCCTLCNNAENVTSNVSHFKKDLQEVFKNVKNKTILNVKFLCLNCCYCISSWRNILNLMVNILENSQEVQKTSNNTQRRSTRYSSIHSEDELSSPNIRQNFSNRKRRYSKTVSHDSSMESDSDVQDKSPAVKKKNTSVNNTKQRKSSSSTENSSPDYSEGRSKRLVKRTAKLLDYLNDSAQKAPGKNVSMKKTRTKTRRSNVGDYISLQLYHLNNVNKETLSNDMHLSYTVVTDKKMMFDIPYILCGTKDLSSLNHTKKTRQRSANNIVKTSTRSAKNNKSKSKEESVDSDVINISSSDEEESDNIISTPTSARRSSRARKPAKLPQMTFRGLELARDNERKSTRKGSAKSSKTSSLPFPCNMCSEAFVSRYRLKLHQQNHETPSTQSNSKKGPKSKTRNKKVISKEKSSESENNSESSDDNSHDSANAETPSTQSNSKKGPKSKTKNKKVISKEKSSESENNSESSDDNSHDSANAEKEKNKEPSEASKDNTVEDCDERTKDTMENLEGNSELDLTTGTNSNLNTSTEKSKKDDSVNVVDEADNGNNKTDELTSTQNSEKDTENTNGDVDKITQVSNDKTEETASNKEDSGTNEKLVSTETSAAEEVEKVKETEVVQSKDVTEVDNSSESITNKDKAEENSPEILIENESVGNNVVEIEIDSQGSNATNSSNTNVSPSSSEDDHIIDSTLLVAEENDSDIESLKLSSHGSSELITSPDIPAKDDEKSEEQTTITSPTKNQLPSVEDNNTTIESAKPSTLDSSSKLSSPVKTTKDSSENLDEQPDSTPTCKNKSLVLDENDSDCESLKLSMRSSSSSQSSPIKPGKDETEKIEEEQAATNGNPTSNTANKTYDDFGAVETFLENLGA